MTEDHTLQLKVAAILSWNIHSSSSMLAEQSPSDVRTYVLYVDSQWVVWWVWCGGCDGCGVLCDGCAVLCCGGCGGCGVVDVMGEGWWVWVVLCCVVGVVAVGWWM